MGPTLGIEEEFVLLDPSTLQTVDIADGAVHALAAAGGGIVAHEFFRSQVEFASPVCETASEAWEAVSAFRRRLGRWAGEAGAVAAGTGTPYRTRGSGHLSEGERYARIADDIGGITAEHQINGLHVHIGLDDREDRVRALNALRPWLPTLLALSSNSPFWSGHDTGFDSWRAIHSRRWTTFGVPPAFADAGDYDDTVSALIGVGATLDRGTINWNARLSSVYPTLELRVCDAQLDPRSVLTLALLIRALAAAGAATAVRPPTSSAREGTVRDAALWHAARYGLGGELVDADGRLVPAQRAIRALFEHAAPTLKAHGDLDVVADGLDRLVRRGNGASAQRRAIRGGVSDLADLYRASLSADDRM
ncbi:MAG TPA: YbdK family carboxylate-amine ligase [Microbacterium sp.]|uniref:carboxylate-amine ligase n=1 Tax=Microbacterium sp. TaxID=51671 RepID=UPI002CA88064|nr:YbdK family carboxylate-amine ligase [Microbacterium sp.]HWI31822.1 YbdK family carboxylate-amine ligase [Microbacterium sp.]